MSAGSDNRRPIGFHYNKLLVTLLSGACAEPTDSFISRKMAKGKISISDIAKQLDISKTTVSFILNGKAREKGISKALEQKVLALVKELNYQPSQFARSLRTGKTNIIGLLVEDISNPFFATLARNIESIADKYNYRIIFCSTENSDQRARNYLQMFWNQGVDGCIITPTSGIGKEIREYAGKGMKLVLFDRYFDHVPTDYVVVDNTLGTYEGTTHLINNGYKKIVFISIDLKLSQMTDREKGYRLAMKEAGLEPNVHSLKFQVSKRYVKELMEFFRKKQDADAAFFATNYLGIGGLEVFSKLNIKIPADMAVVSFDDNEIFNIYSPTITAVQQPTREMSAELIRILLERINGHDHEKTLKSVLYTRLIIRESSLKKQITVDGI